MKTPLEKLAGLPDVHTFLKPGITLQALQLKAKQRNDLQAFKLYNQVKSELFSDILKRA